MKKYIFNLLFLSLGLLIISPVAAFASEDLTITKVCSPSSCTSSDSFPFIVNDSNGIIGSSFTLDSTNNFTKTFTSFQNAQTSITQQPTNIYTIIENTPSGWDAPSINCGGANIAFDTSVPNNVTFDYTPTPMAPLAQITCTFTNTKQVVTTDLCSNIAGAQSTIPTGYIFNAASGQCDQTVTVVDLCSNVTGNQTTVPTGYIFNAASGQCDQTSTTTTLPDGCSSSAGFSTTTGAPCTGTTTPTTGGSAGGPGGMAPGGLPVINNGNTNNFVFLKDLKVGSKSPDVTTLQKFLEKNGFLKMPKGNAYGFFGSSTKTALIKWQKKNGITPSGNFGPQSRKKIRHTGIVTLVRGVAPAGTNPTTQSAYQDCYIGVPGYSDYNPNNCAKLVVYKKVPGLSTQAFNFDLSFNGDDGTFYSYKNFTLDDDGSNSNTNSNTITLRVYPGLQYFLHETPASGFTTKVYKSTPSPLVNLVAQTTQTPTYNLTTPAGGATSSVTFVNTKKKTLPTSVTLGTSLSATELVGDSNTTLTGVNVGLSASIDASHLGSDSNVGTDTTKVDDPTISNTVGTPQGLEGTVVGVGGKILYSSDQGATWFSKLSGVTYDLKGVSFFDKYNGIAVGNYGVVTKSTDDGVTWTPQVSGTTQNLNSVSYFGTSSLAVAVGDNGTIIRTSNGGANWTAQTSPTTNKLNGVSFSGANGVAVGDGGKIINTSNGGTLWTVRTSNTTANLYGVYMSSPFIGLAVGASGTIVRTTDGGVTWTSQVSGTTQNLNSVSFSTSTMATAVGDNGTIIKSINQNLASPSWVIQTNAPITSTFGSQNFRGVSYYKGSLNTGVIVSTHNTTARTINGGTLWTDITNPYTSTTVSAQFNGVDLH
ncbi:MAG: YCF48-related protein [Minisyncoccia bacterium]